MDIRTYKETLRAKSKKMRRELDPSKKAKMDLAITQRVQSLFQYREASTLLCYVSTAIEVDTKPLILQALADGKKVAVPRCIDGKREMEFYLITSFDDLEKRTFGVLEPIITKCKKLTDFTGSLCIIPALVYDFAGYRLGYGAGYYDRFLSDYRGYKIGIVYKNCTLRYISHGRFDIPVDMLVTESFFRITDRAGIKAPTRHSLDEVK